MADYKTEFGVVHYTYGTCKDNYDNIVNFKGSKGHTAVKLQRPVLRAFQEAERRYAKKLHPVKYRMGLVKSLAIPVTGTWRSCAYQAQLYASDPNRYASPAGTGHPRGIAIDIYNGQKHQSLVTTILHNVGFKQARPDEPWHFTFPLSV